MLGRFAEGKRVRRYEASSSKEYEAEHKSDADYHRNWDNQEFARHELVFGASYGLHAEA